MTDTSAEAIATHIQELLRNPDAIGLVDWLPMTRWAETQGSTWIDALKLLSTDESNALFHKLRRDDAGPFAVSLLIVTARRADELRDGDVRDWLIQDAITASHRRIEMITELRDKLEEQVERMEARQLGEAELESEITRLEERRNELSLAETGKQYRHVHEIEQEIIRLEAFERSLQSWVRDEESRLGKLDELKDDTEKLGRRKEDVEGEIASAIAKRDKLQGELDYSEKKKLDLEDDVKDLAGQVTELKREISQLEQQRVAPLSAEVVERWYQKHRLEEEVAALESKRRELEDYDERSHRKERDDLKKGNRELSHKKEGMEREIRSLKISEAKTQTELKRVQAELDVAQVRVDDINRQIADTREAHNRVLEAEAEAEARRRELFERLTSRYAPSGDDQQATAEQARPVEGSSPTLTNSPHSSPSDSDPTTGEWSRRWRPL
jgi:chromosome segregation ATPase